jgi:outer membrane protein assembly factor BamB
MKPIIRLTQALLWTLLLTGCSMFGGDEDDAAIEPAELVKFQTEVEIERQWTVKIGSGTREYWAGLKPAASRSAIFAAGSEGNILAVDKDTGQRIWATDLAVVISGGVGYGSGMVMVGTIEGTVYALDEDTGSTLWTAQVSTEILASPKTNGKVVVVQTVDNRLFALDASSGEELWQHDGDAPILTVRGIGEALVTDNMVLAGFDSGKLIAFNASNGALIWESRIALPQGRTELERMVDIDGQPLLVGDVIYAVTYQGRLGALSRGTGRSLWFQDSSSHFSPAQSGDKVFVTEEEDRVRAFKSGSGQVVWSNEQLFLRRLTGPAKLAGTMAVADAEGFLHLLDPVDGHFVGRVKVDGSGVSAPLLSLGDSLIVQSNAGTLSAYKLK